MNRHYHDLLSLSTSSPKWFDERAVPRFCEFSPGEVADIYARECALLLIACQSCEREFRVAVSIGLLEMAGSRREGLAKRPWLDPKTVEFGDPPNVECCPAGPTMSSVPLRVIEFWSRHDREWMRLPEHEGVVECEWMKEET